jgi:hypothetical protein
MNIQKSKLDYKSEPNRPDIKTIRIIDYDKHIAKQVRFDYTRPHWKQIPRANDASKTLPLNTVAILGVIVAGLNKGGTIAIKHKCLSMITYCSNSQNANLLKQLADILDISYHTKVIIEGKAHFNYFLIRHTEKGYPIIQTKAALLTQYHFVGSVAKTPRKQKSGGSNV